VVDAQRRSSEDGGGPCGSGSGPAAQKSFGTCMWEERDGDELCLQRAAAAQTEECGGVLTDRQEDDDADTKQREGFLL
jgi:hypothetical protein